MTEGLAEVQRLDGLVAYQDGAVVSRILHRAGGGNVTLFAFDRGESLSEHTTPHDAIVYVVEGRASIEIAGRAHALEAGYALLMPGGVPHAVRAEARMKMLLVMIQAG